MRNLLCTVAVNFLGKNIEHADALFYKWKWTTKIKAWSCETLSKLLLLTRRVLITPHVDKPNVWLKTELV